MLYLILSFIVLVLILLKPRKDLKISLEDLVNHIDFITLVLLSILIGALFTLIYLCIPREPVIVKDEIQKVNGTWFKESGAFTEVYLKDGNEVQKSSIRGTIDKIKYEGDNGYIVYYKADKKDYDLVTDVLFFPTTLIDPSIVLNSDIEIILPESEKE